MEAKGVSIYSDGWADAQKSPLINFMAVTESGPMFLNSINAEGEVKKWHYIAEKLEDYIKEVGPQNVIQIITDNAPACKAAGAIVESKYLYIFWTLVQRTLWILHLKIFLRLKIKRQML